jgi:hypothetical protein
MKMTHPDTNLEIEVPESLASSYESQGWRAATVDAPAGNASLVEWQEFARTKGFTDDDLDGKTRDDLRAALS